MGNKFRLVILFVSLGVLVVYFLTSAGNTPFNHFTLLADAFLKGKLYIQGDYPWLEKIPIDQSKFYVANPPMPAILAIPFVFFFGKSFPQQYIAHVLGMGIVMLTMILSLHIKKDLKLAIWSGLLAGLGTIMWFMSSVGSIWYLDQITSAFFLTWVLVEITGRARPILLGILFGAIFLSRTHIALAFPFIVFLRWDKFKKPQNLLLLLTTFSIFAGIDFWYNYQRFGNMFSNGYDLIPHVHESSWFPQGIWNPVYIPKNLAILFAGLPKVIQKWPYLIPTWAGMAIWLTTPAFIFSLSSSIKENSTKLLWIAILVVAFIVTSHGGTGYAQFGYRFAVDFYPFLIFLAIKGIARSGLKWPHWALLFVSILVNTWGVILINKLGLVSL